MQKQGKQALSQHCRGVSVLTLAGPSASAEKHGACQAGGGAGRRGRAGPQPVVATVGRRLYLVVGTLHTAHYRTLALTSALEEGCAGRTPSRREAKPCEGRARGERRRGRVVLGRRASGGAEAESRTGGSSWGRARVVMGPP